jgi:hypothetical protein
VCPSGGEFAILALKGWALKGLSIPENEAPRGAEEMSKNASEVLGHGGAHITRMVVLS